MIEMNEIKDGSYTVEVFLSGGSGRASVKSPAELTVEGGKMRTEIEWSSPDYDYMEVEGREYYPAQTDGNSRFVIDVPALDEEIPVKAETVAMSEPHLIEYSLYFDSSTVRGGGVNYLYILPGTLALLIFSAAMGFYLRRKHEK